MKKRLLSLLLASMLVVQMLPTFALAEELENISLLKAEVEVGGTEPGEAGDPVKPDDTAEDSTNEATEPTTSSDALPEGGETASLVGLISTPVVWDGTTETEPPIVDDVYQIGTAAELAWFRTKVNQDNSYNAVLIDDIDLAENEWEPIGTTSNTYKGIFNGNHHTITGLKITEAKPNKGLFGVINGATIQNLNVEGYINCGTKNYIGGIVGQIVTNGVIENCSFSGEVTGAHVGGLVGGYVTTPQDSVGSVSIRNCFNTADVTYTGTFTSINAGGIVGNANANCIIINCYNTGTISSTGRSGGIAGNASGAVTIENCYNIGSNADKGNYVGGIVGWNFGTIKNCYWLEQEKGAGGGTGTLGNECEKISSPDGLHTKLGDKFIENQNVGSYPLLFWQGQETENPKPSISISGSTTLHVNKAAGLNQTTLSLEMKNLEPDDIDTVTWAVETAKGSSTAEHIVDWQTADGDDTHLIVTAKNGGMATITATVEVDGEELTATRILSVIPQITAAEIKNVKQPGAVAIGQTVEVKVFVLGGEEYDYENYPPLTYQWRYNSPLSSANISGATARTFTIPTTAGYSEWQYLYVEIMSGGVVVKVAQDVRGQLRSADYGTLYPVAYDPDFTLPTEIKDNKSLVLPTSNTKDGVTANISWTSDNEAIDVTTGSIKRPETGTIEVKLTARYELGTAFANRDFTITIYSEEAASNPANKSYLQKAAESLGKWYGPLVPVYGKDTNIAAMLKAELAAKGFGDLSVAVKAITEKYGGAGLAPNGDITYFYADPNGSRGLWFGQYRVTFTLTKDYDTLDVEDLVVNLYWDKNRVEETMRSEILSGVTETVILDKNHSRNAVTTNLVLPKVVDNKKWALIEWSSSDESVISISNENQGTADTLFAPYIGKVYRCAEDKEVTLTAKFNFQRTSGREPQIALYKTFTVKVPALTSEEAEVVRLNLLAKIDAGITKVGLRDYVTGQQLTHENGVYTTANDIQLPTTRDFGVDGKYFPITITSSDNNTIVAPNVANAARVIVYRPPVGSPAKKVTLTISITDKAQGISASKSFTINVLPLQQAEIDDALALMDRVKTAYFEGLNDGRYRDEYSITGGLHSFQEAVWNDDKTNVRWIYHAKDAKRNGIIADTLDNWEEQEAWRAFRTSDSAVIDHETLNLVAKPAEDTFIRIESVLTHEVFGKYAGRPGYEGFEGLYKQPVNVYVMVHGNNHISRTPQELAQMREEAIARISAPITAGFVLTGTRPQTNMRMMMAMSAMPTTTSISDVVIDTTVGGLDAGTTVFGLFRKVLAEQGYTYQAVGSYVKSITDAEGNTLSERDLGPNSGWIYTVNGKMPSIYMNGYTLKEGDEVVVRFTDDYTKEDGFHTGGGGNNGGGNSGGGKDADSGSESKNDTIGTKNEVVAPTFETNKGIVKELAEEGTKANHELPGSLTKDERKQEFAKMDSESAQLNKDSQGSQATKKPVVVTLTVLTLTGVLSAAVLWYRRKAKFSPNN